MAANNALSGALMSAGNQHPVNTRNPEPAKPPVPSATPGEAPQSAKAKRNNLRIEPSAQSGGVPEPTAQYLEQALRPPVALPEARRILVVIDLNGTLLHRPNRKNPSRFVQRPFAKTFLAYCIRTFAVAIWSSARPENVFPMVEQLIEPEDRARLVAVWGRERFGLTKEDYNQKVLCYKRLTKLWETPEVAQCYAAFHQGQQGTWSQADTILVDDSIEKARSEPHNLIQIPEFVGDAAEEGFILPQVHDYLNECSRQADVSSFMRATPFAVNQIYTL